MFQLIGWLSSLSVSASLYPLIVLSASQVINLVPELSNVIENIPASESNDPG